MDNIKQVYIFCIISNGDAVCDVTENWKCHYVNDSNC